MIRKLLVLTAAAAAVAVGVGAGADDAVATDISPPPIEMPDTRPDVVVTKDPIYPYTHYVTNVGSWSKLTGYFKVLVHAWRTTYPSYNTSWYGFYTGTWGFSTNVFLLSGGESQWFTVGNPYLAPPCGWLITADPLNEVAERNEGNNTYYHDAC